MVTNLSGLARIEDEASAFRQALAVEDVVPRGHERAVDGVAHRVVGDAIPAVGEIPLVANLEQVRALAHVLCHGGEHRPHELPVHQIVGGVLQHHAAQLVIARSHEQPVAALFLNPEDLGVTEVVLGVALWRKEQGLGILDPVLRVRAGGVHGALFASSAVARVVMTGVEEVVQAVRVLHDGAGAQCGVGVRALAVVQHHAMILIAIELLGAVLVDGMVALAVVAGVVEVVQLQRAVRGHEGHDVAHVATLRPRIQVVLHRLIRVVRQRRGQRYGSLFLRGCLWLGRVGGLCGASRAAPRQKQNQGQRQSEQMLPFAHCEHSFPFSDPVDRVEGRLVVRSCRSYPRPG